MMIARIWLNNGLDIGGNRPGGRRNRFHKPVLKIRPSRLQGKRYWVAAGCVTWVITLKMRKNFTYCIRTVENRVTRALAGWLFYVTGTSWEPNASESCIFVEFHIPGILAPPKFQSFSEPNPPYGGSTPWRRENRTITRSIK
jgi:hypothetical protein